MQNPYLTVKKLTATKILFRLVKSPQRLLATLLLFLLPLGLSVGGGIDLLGGWMYSTSHRGQIDEREATFFINCLQQKGLCDKNTRQKFWPLDRLEVGPVVVDLSQPAPFLVGGLFVVAFFSLAALTSPRWVKSEAKGNESLVPTPAAEPDKNWLIGGLVRREWQSDPGYFYLRKGFKNPYFLTSEMLRTNLLIVAPPGSGKSFSVVRPFITFARKSNSSALVFDAKGRDFDPKLFDLNFDLVNFESSIRLTLFAGQTPAQSGEQLAEALIPQLNEHKAYFSEVAKNSMSALVEGYYAAYQRYPELLGIMLFLNETSRIKDLQKILAEKVADSSEAERLITNLEAVLRLQETKGDLLGNLRLALQPLTKPEIGRFLEANPRPGSYRIKELISQPRLVRFALPVAEFPKVAPVLGRLILTQFNLAVLSPDVPKEHFKCASVDEAHNFVTESLGKGMAQARSNNAGFILSFQSLGQVEDKNLLTTLFATSGIKLVMAGVGDEDAERFSKTFGELELPYVTHSQATSYSSGSSSGNNSGREGNSNNSTTSHNRQRNEGKSQVTRLRRQFLPSEIRSLPRFHALIESSDAYGRRWFGQVVDLTDSTVTALEKSQQEKTKVEKSKETLPESSPLPLPSTELKPERNELQIALPTWSSNPEPVTEGYTPEEGRAESNPHSEESRLSLGKLSTQPETRLSGWQLPAAREQPGESKVLEVETANQNFEAEDIKALLSTEGLKPAQIPSLLNEMLERGRNLRELVRLVEYAHLTQPRHRASFIARLIRADDYPDEARLNKARQKPTSSDEAL